MEQEVEAIVVRLIGEGSSFQGMMLQAARSSDDTAKQVMGAAKQIEDIGKSLKKFASDASSSLTSIGAMGYLKSALSMFTDTETATVKLKAAIAANGGAVDETLARYKEYAKVLKDTTGMSADETLGLLKKAEAFGLTGDAAERAVTNSVRMAAAADVDAASAMRVTVALEQGDIKRAMMFSRMIPQLRRVRDETEFLTIAQKLMTQGQAQAAELMNTTAGVMKRFQGTVKAITKQLGETVAEGIKPAVKWATELLNNFTHLDDGTKRLIVSTLVLVSAALMIAPALGKIGFVAGIVFNPLTIAIGLVLASAAIMINKFGGFVPILEYLKGRFADFIEWVKPFGPVLAGVFDAATTLIQEALVWVKDTAIVIWHTIASDAEMDWARVKQAAIDALLGTEFIFRNFGRSMSLAWVAIKTELWETASYINYVLTKVVPASLTWLYDNWSDVWRDIGRFTWDVLVYLSANIRNFFSQIWASVTGEDVDWAAGWTAFQQSFQRSSRELILPPQVLNPLQQQLRREFDELGGALGEMWSEFYARRIRELGVRSPAAEHAAYQAGEGLGAAMNEGVHKEAGKLDYVLRYSAEAMRRLRSYFDMLKEPLKAETGHGAIGAGGTLHSTVDSNNTTNSNNTTTNNQYSVESAQQAVAATSPASWLERELAATGQVPEYTTSASEPVSPRVVAPSTRQPSTSTLSSQATANFQVTDSTSGEVSTAQRVIPNIWGVMSAMTGGSPNRTSPEATASVQGQLDRNARQQVIQFLTLAESNSARAEARSAAQQGAPNQTYHEVYNEALADAVNRRYIEGAQPGQTPPVATVTAGRVIVNVAGQSESEFTGSGGSYGTPSTIVPTRELPNDAVMPPQPRVLTLAPNVSNYNVQNMRVQTPSIDIPELDRSANVAVNNNYNSSSREFNQRPTLASTPSRVVPSSLPTPAPAYVPRVTQPSDLAALRQQFPGYGRYGVGGTLDYEKEVTSPDNYSEVDEPAVQGLDVPRYNANNDRTLPRLQVTPLIDIPVPRGTQMNSQYQFINIANTLQQAGQAMLPLVSRANNYAQLAYGEQLTDVELARRSSFAAVAAQEEMDTDDSRRTPNVQISQEAANEVYSRQEPITPTIANASLAEATPEAQRTVAQWEVISRVANRASQSIQIGAAVNEIASPSISVAAAHEVSNDEAERDARYDALYAQVDREQWADELESVLQEVERDARYDDLYQQADRESQSVVSAQPPMMWAPDYRPPTTAQVSLDRPPMTWAPDYSPQQTAGGGYDSEQYAMSAVDSDSNSSAQQYDQNRTNESRTSDVLLRTISEYLRTISTREPIVLQEAGF